MSVHIKPAFLYPYPKIQSLFKLIDYDLDESVNQISYEKGYVYTRDDSDEPVGFLSVLPYIETAGSIYYTSRSSTCHISRVILTKPIPFSTILSLFYDETDYSLFEFPLKLTSQPIPSAYAFNTRLGFYLQKSGYYARYCQTTQQLPRRPLHRSQLLQKVI